MYSIWIPKPESFGQYYKLKAHLQFAFPEAFYGGRIVAVELIDSGYPKPVTLTSFRNDMANYFSEVAESARLWNCGIKDDAGHMLYTGDMHFTYVRFLLDGILTANLELSYRFDLKPEEVVLEIGSWREGF